MPPDVDLAVIGAGAAGLSVTSVAARLGLRVALIERGEMGGECLNTGCVPSKALLAAAHAVRDSGRWPALGLVGAPPRPDWDAIQAGIRAVIDEIAPIDSEARYTALGARVLRGHARFIGPAALSVALRDGTVVPLTARRFVIAAGSRAAVPDIPGLTDVPSLTHTHLFGLPEAPRHLLILGGGPMGLEMAQAHAALGCRVTVIEAGRIAARDDPELVDRLREGLSRDGIEIIEHATVIRAEPGPTLVLADGGRIAGSHLLIATGRRPNIEDLGLDAAGIRAGEGGIVTDRGLRSLTNRRVFAAGDIADPIGLGPRAFTHVASHHAGIIIRRAIFRLPARLDYRALPRVTFTAPELAQIGPTEAEARAAGHAVRIARWKLADNDRARADRDTVGMAKLVLAPSGRILGAGLLAPHAGEMVGAFTLAIGRGLKASALAGMIVPYPTLAEIGPRAAADLLSARLFAAAPRRLARLLRLLP